MAPANPGNIPRPELYRSCGAGVENPIYKTGELVRQLKGWCYFQRRLLGHYIFKNLLIINWVYDLASPASQHPVPVLFAQLFGPIQ